MKPLKPKKCEFEVFAQDLPKTVRKSNGDGSFVVEGFANFRYLGLIECLYWERWEKAKEKFSIPHPVLHQIS